MELFIALLAALTAIFGPIIVWQQTRINAKDAELAKTDEQRRTELREDFDKRVEQLRADFENQITRIRADCAAQVAALEQRAVRWEQVALEGRAVIVKRAMETEQAMQQARGLRDREVTHGDRQPGGDNPGAGTR